MKANHPPVVKLSNPLDIIAKPGSKVELSAEGTTDPDGDKIMYSWWEYEEADSYGGRVEIINADKQKSFFKVPKDAKNGDAIHIVCEASDNGSPQLTRYQRVILTVKK